MSGFSNPIAGASGALTIPQLQSPDYVAGVSGWRIGKNGDAEFNNVETRGSFFGSEFIINDLGAFFYSGAPAAGNLIASIASVTGTDGFGNGYKAGFNLYAGTGTAGAQLVSFGGNPSLIFTPAGAAHLTTPPQIFGTAANAGLVNEVLELILTSGKATGNPDAAVQLFSASADGTQAARIVLEFGGVIAATLTAAGFSADTWHTAVLVNTWAGSGGAGGLFYTLTVDGQVRIIADIINTTATGNSVCFTLPAGYRPATGQNRPAAWNNVVASNAASAPWVFVGSSGQVQITGIPTGQAGKEIFFDVSIPLAVL